MPNNPTPASATANRPGGTQPPAQGRPRQPQSPPPQRQPQGQ
ncbi:unnamed protein product, partial [Allacma fusca]